MWRASLVLALLIAMMSVASAKTDFRPMSYFVGNWLCKYMVNPDSSLVGKTFTFSGTMDPAGYWEVLNLENGTLNVTRDAATKQWVFVYTGYGGDYGVLMTSGWHGNTLVLKDVVDSGGAPLGSTTFTRSSDRQYSATYTVSTAHGTEVYRDVCSRM